MEALWPTAEESLSDVLCSSATAPSEEIIEEGVTGAKSVLQNFLVLSLSLKRCWIGSITTVVVVVFLEKRALTCRDNVEA